MFWTLIFSELISVHLCRIHDESCFSHPGGFATINIIMIAGSEIRSCEKVEVAVLDSPSLIVLMGSVDVK